MKRQETHYKKKWKGMAEGAVNFDLPMDGINSISINNYRKVISDCSGPPTQKSKPEIDPVHNFKDREHFSTSCDDRVGGKLNTTHFLSSRNSAFRPVSPKQKG